MKLRLMGKPQEIEFFEKQLRENKNITVLSVSKPYKNRYSDIEYRVYIEIEQAEKE